MTKPNENSSGDKRARQNGQQGRPPRGGIAAKAIGLGAAALALAAATNYTLARRAERRDGPEGKFVRAGGLRLHYIERGSGPPIVLLHGNGTMARDFAISGLVDLLAADHRVIAFDRPGFGFSERPRDRIWDADNQAALLHEAIAKLGVQRPVLVGHSWGTLVALAMALRHQPEIAGLALLAGYYFPSLRSDAALMFWPAVPLLGDVLRYTISPLLGRLMAPAAYRKLFAPAPVARRFAGEFPTELSLRPWQIRATAAEAALMVPAAASMAGRYPELALRVEIIAGAGDRIVDFDRQPARLNEDLPNSMLHKFSGMGHMVHHTAPERVATIIRALSGVRETSGGARRASAGRSEFREKDLTKPTPASI